ncbi:MAG: ester cyclase [Chloroflexota bacterium]|nr:ester cyclase [Dehalococcoidia bacterium]MDW8254278.1 ester cyclase [Chloroflexota bacterium]
MSIEQNKMLVRRWIEEAVNQGKEEVLDEIIHPDMINHEGVTPTGGREGFKETMAVFRTAIPDQRMEILDLIAEEDKVAVRLTWSGTPTSPFMGRPVNGKPFTVTHTHIFHVRDGMLYEHWANRDDLGMWRQIAAE